MSKVTIKPTQSAINPLSSNGFQFIIQKAPELNYFSQSVELPGISLPSAVMPTPKVPIPLIGETPHFDPFNLTFLVDSDLTNYLAMYKWILGSSFTEILPSELFEQFTNLDHYSDGTLHVLSSSNNIIRTFEFIDLHPVSLSGIQFITTSTDDEYISCTVTFDYSYFRVLR